MNEKIGSISPCEKQILAMNEVMESLEGVTSMLEEKLRPLRNPNILRAAEKDIAKDPEPPLSPVVSSIKTLACRGRQIRTQLESLLDELEC